MERKEKNWWTVLLRPQQQRESRTSPNKVLQSSPMAKSPSFVNSWMLCCGNPCPAHSFSSLSCSQPKAKRQGNLRSCWCPLLWVQTASLTFQSSVLCSLVLSYKWARVFLMPPLPFCSKQALSLPADHALLLTHGNSVPNAGLCSQPQTCE